MTHSLFGFSLGMDSNGQPEIDEETVVYLLKNFGTLDPDEVQPTAHQIVESHDWDRLHELTTLGQE